MANNTSAVLDVVAENKNVSSILKDNKSENQRRSSIHSNNSTTIDNSVVQSPSLESFSTIHDISELNMDENSEFCVKVDSPQKNLETLETYITFRITTKVAKVEFEENEYVVRRRYNEFIWLRQKLIESRPFCIVPPLPIKHSLTDQLDRFSKEFVLKRMKGLNVFISRVVQHPILSCNKHFKLFLTEKNADFSYRKQRTIPEAKTRLMHSNSSRSTLKHRHLEFDKTKTYLITLTDKLHSVEKISSRINKERIDLITELNSFHPVFTTWATGEIELADLLQKIGSAIERSTAAQSILVQSYKSIIEDPVKDFVNYIDVVQETLNKRDAFQSAYELSIEELNKRNSEKDKLVAISRSPSQNIGGFYPWKQSSFDDKLEKLGTYIPQLMNKVESNQNDLECANESLHADLERWHLEKQQCLKKMLLDFVNKQIEYHQVAVNAWEFAAKGVNQQNLKKHFQ